MEPLRLPAVEATANALTPARVRWLLRADGFPAADAQVRAYLDLGGVASVRSAHLAWIASVGLSGGGTAARVHAAQAPDALVRAAMELDLPVGDLLGAHESLLAVVTQTVAMCLAHDGEPLEALRVATEVLRAAPPEARIEAQRRLLAHPRPGTLRHFARVWPAESDLAILRSAYLGALGRRREAEASVVGCVDLLAGAGVTRGQAVDWDAERGDRISERHLRLRCGVLVPVEALDRAERAGTFSVLELLEHRPPQLSLLARPAEVADAAPDVPPQRCFAAVDRALLVLARAVLGAACPPAAQWLHPPTAARPALDAPSPSPLVGGEAGELAGACAAARARPTREPVIRAALDAPVSSGGDEAWQRAYHAATLLRWADGVEDVCARGAPRARRRAFRDVVRVWLRERGPMDRARLRKPDGDGESAPEGANCFDLDLAGSLADCRMVAHCAGSTENLTELLTWVVNEWPEGRAIVRALAEGAGLEGRLRRGIVWVHHALLDRRERALTAFKKAVSIAGLVPWCVAEVDEAVERTRPAGAPPVDWRTACARVTAELPAEPWTAARVWAGGRRATDWLNAHFSNGAHR